MRQTNAQILLRSDLIVNSGVAPEIETVETQEVCPSYLENYDLTQFEDTILNGLTNVSVSYFDDYISLTSNGDPIDDPMTYDLSLDVATIYVKVSDLDSECSAYTEINFNYYSGCEVSCGIPLNMTFCYANGDEREFTYTSATGEPLVVSFNEGSIHTADRLIIIADGIELYNGFGNDVGNGNVFDLSGLTFMSAGSNITVKVQSNFNNSCSSTEGYNEWDFDVICSSSLGGINVSAFLDLNSNSVFDDSESLYTQGYFTYELNNDGVVNTLNTSTGTFFIGSDDASNTYDFTYNLYPEYQSCYSITTSSFNDVSVETGSVVSVDFPIENIAPCDDLGVYLINSGIPPRPGFTHLNQLVLQNSGFSTVTSGTVEVVLDPLLEYQGVTGVNPNYTITDTATGFTLDFVNLEQGDTEVISISLLCPATVDLGEVVENTAAYLDGSDDLVLSNNNSSLSEVVVGSYDPNDKMESHGPQIVFDEFTASDEYLYYTIRFQNLGTFAADFVRIEDALDTGLDATTFQMLRASHDYTVTRTGNDLEWYFEDINLPAAQDDEAGSNGYVYFKIKPASGYAIGDMIPNTADIYFDFNEPVVTNTFETTFVETLSAEAFALNTFSLSPNPATDTVSITMTDHRLKIVNVSLFDVQGKQMLNTQISEDNQTDLNVSQLQSGLYFVKITNGQYETVKKLVIN